MTEPNGERQEERRESIGSIRIRWRPLFSILFVAQALPGISFIIWLELALASADSPVDTIKAIIWGTAAVGAASVAITGTFVEALELMLGTRDIINDWLQKRRDEAKAEGVEIGIEQGVEIGEERGIEQGIEQGIELGREQVLAEAQAWYKRQQTALKKGETFDEPPPWDDKP